MTGESTGLWRQYQPAVSSRKLRACPRHKLTGFSVFQRGKSACQAQVSLQVCINIHFCFSSKISAIVVCINRVSKPHTFGMRSYFWPYSHTSHTFSIKLILNLILFGFLDSFWLFQPYSHTFWAKSQTFSDFLLEILF